MGKQAYLIRAEADFEICQIFDTKECVEFNQYETVLTCLTLKGPVKTLIPSVTRFSAKAFVDTEGRKPPEA